MKAVTLLYHDVINNGDYASSGFQSGDANFYKLEQSEFIRHLDAIVEEYEYNAEDLNKLYDGHIEHIPFYITFDDGGNSFLNPIADILESYGWKGIFFISTDFIDTPGFMSADQIKLLAKRGHVIGSHSCSHPQRISDCSYQELLNEWSRSKEILENIVGEEVTTASVPGGFLSGEIEKAVAEAGYKSLFTSEPQKSFYQVDGCFVLGRYSIVQGVTATTAVKLAKKGMSYYQTWQYLFWNIKKFAKNNFSYLYKWIRLKILN